RACRPRTSSPTTSTCAAATSGTGGRRRGWSSPYALPPATAYPRAKAAARRALQLDPFLAEAHASLGYIALYYDWDWDAAEAAFQRSIELNPSYTVAHQWYANHLVARGRFDEA